MANEKMACLEGVSGGGWRGLVVRLPVGCPGMVLMVLAALTALAILAVLSEHERPQSGLVNGVRRTIGNSGPISRGLGSR